MNKWIFYISILILSFSCFSCDKYEDGPLISFRSKKNRLLGKWEVQEFLKNDENITVFYQDTCGCLLELKYDFVPHTFTEKGNYMVLICELNGWNYGPFPFAYYNWDLTKDGNHIFMQLGLNNDSSYRYGMYPLTYSPGYYSYWKILRLTKKEMCLQIDDLTNLYTIKFKKL